jgi:hypothetical protein
VRKRSKSVAVALLTEYIVYEKYINAAGCLNTIIVQEFI